MRNFLTTVLIFSSLLCKANVRDSIPNGLPQNVIHGWVGVTQQAVSDSGVIMFKNDDTTAKPKSLYSAIKFVAGKPYYWDGSGWRAFAAPATGFVTRTELLDSLLDYVNLWGTQTVLNTAPKSWEATQTFDGIINSNNTINQLITGLQTNTHTKSDSLNNIRNNPTNLFLTFMRNSDYAYHNSFDYPSVAVVRNNLLLSDVQDTANALLTPYGAFNSQISFRNLNSSPSSTFSLINFNKNGSWNSGSFGLAALSDSGQIAGHTKTYNLEIPFGGINTFVGVQNKGEILSFTDIDVGNTFYLDQSGSSDSLGRVVTHRGLVIEDLKSNAINTNTIAIDQKGDDTVRLKSTKIFLPNLPNATTSYSVYWDNTLGKISYGVGGAANDYSYHALTFSSTPTLDYSVGEKFRIRLTGNATISFANVVNGKTITLLVVQDGTGNRTLTFPSNTVFPLGVSSGSHQPNLSTGANQYDKLTITYDNLTSNYEVEEAADYNP